MSQSELRLKGALLRQEVLMEVLKTRREAMLVDNRERERDGHYATYDRESFDELQGHFNEISKNIEEILT